MRLAWALGLAVFVLVWSQTLAPRSVGGPAGFVVIRGVSMLPTFHGGDLVITHPRGSYGKGDIIAYKVPQGQFGSGILVIHRIVGGSARTGFNIQGDNNGFVDPWHPRPHDIVGKAWVLVPRLGLLLTFLHAPVPSAALAAAVVVAMIALPPKKKSRNPAANIFDLKPRLERRARTRAAHAAAAGIALLLVASAAVALARQPAASRPQDDAAPALAKRACLAFEQSDHAFSEAGSNAAMTQALNDSRLAASKDQMWAPLARAIQASDGSESGAVNVAGQCAGVKR